MLKITGERKIAAARLAELTGERASYTRMPRCAYEVGSFAIERDGTVTVYEDADLAPLRTLAQEGLLEGWEEPSIPTLTEAATGAETKSTEEETPTGLTISLPLTGHTAESLRNLVTMIYSRGNLISKATGGNFSCSLAQVEALKDCLTVEKTISNLSPGLIGLSISDSKITFTGFPFTDDPEKINAFTQLAAQMNYAARKQKRVMPRIMNENNERYSFRIWLIRIGMDGDEFKMARKILMEHLSGHTAFRTPEAAEKARIKNIQKRDALRAAKAATKANRSPTGTEIARIRQGTTVTVGETPVD